MKIAVITANLGGIDNVHPFAPQDIEFDRIYITDENNPYPFHTVDSRLAAKFFKILPHIAFPGYDIYIWVDANVEILSPNFVSGIIDRMCSVSISRHPFRKTIGDEAHFIADAIKHGDTYLSVRYNAASILAEAANYGSDLPLYWCGLFARKNEPHINKMAEMWYIDNVQWTNFDQLSFPFEFSEAVIKEMNWGNFYENETYKIHKHKKLM